MRRSKWLGFAATAFCALILGAGTSVATQSDNNHRPADGVSQYGKVDNGTEQHADSFAKTPQENKNVPFSFFEIGSNNGKVDQFNKAHTNSQSENSNKTYQDLHQDQHAKFEGRDHRDCGCHDKGRDDGKSRGDRWGKNDGSRGGQCGCDDKRRGDKGDDSYERVPARHGRQLDDAARGLQCQDRADQRERSHLALQRGEQQRLG